MIHLMLVIAIVWLTFKTVMRGQPHDSAAGSVGIFGGLLFGVISGFSFITGGWWSLIGYAFFAFTLAGWMHARKTLPEDIDRELEERETLLKECDELRAEFESSHPKPVRLP